MEAGGYTDPSQVDVCGMSPLAHALDQSVWSLRAALSAADLIRVSPIETINQFIETDEPGYPAGLAPVHLLASGVDKNFMRPNLMIQLIERKVGRHGGSDSQASAQHSVHSCRPSRLRYSMEHSVPGWRRHKCQKQPRT